VSWAWSQALEGLNLSDITVVNVINQEDKLEQHKGLP
jgi:hypothetical protein